ncbi:hypothetical protein [Paraburkholderia oxyphila]|uniref:hypothetical protein n=1 Tax=Paraburkholderia oxyphila TaxID=614212 RepID=UPI000694C74D|nr:hypothetical protein [Paraburkholderia oxyphila]
MHEPERDANNPDALSEAERARLKTLMRSRAWLKIVIFTICVDQVLTAVFTYVGQMIDPAMGGIETLVFSCLTCVFVSNWLVSDARAAWDNAKKHGHVATTRSGSGGRELNIADACPRRWLVMLHIELNPELAEIA